MIHPERGDVDLSTERARISYRLITWVFCKKLLCATLVNSKKYHCTISRRGTERSEAR